MDLNNSETRVYTIDDIAKELGVSKTTVSRAISGKGRISAETRSRVLEFIEKHNYRPNAVAKSLAQSKTYNLGMVLPGDYNAADVPFFQECMGGICEVASENDYDVLISMVNGGAVGQLERVIDNHKVDGVIVSRSTIDSPVIKMLKEKKIPFVVVGHCTDPQVLYVDNANREASRDLTALLITKGMRRLALLGGNERHYVTHSRLQGFEDACRQAGLSMKEQLVFMNTGSTDRMAKAVDTICQRRADCIVCMDDYLCHLALLQLRERRINIPQDIRVASFYDSNLLEHNLPPITSLRFDARAVGVSVCKALLEVLNGQQVESSVLPEYQMILRDSTK